MFWKSCLALIVILMMAACSSNQAASEAVMELSPASIDGTATFTPTAIPPTVVPTVIRPTLVPTSTPIPIQTSNISSAPACAITRTDLPIYTVVSGDTLSNIARRTNSTVAQLAEINCLPDASQITVGQQLRVLQAPTTTSNTADVITQPENASASSLPSHGIQGTVYISPGSSAMINDIEHFTVHEDTPLTLRWDGVPTHLGITQVEFIYVDIHYTVAHVSIGIDTNLTDGASITWTASKGVEGKIFAVSRLPGQFHEGVQSTEVTIEAIPSRVGPRGAVSVDPNIQAGTPADWSDYVIEPNSTVTIVWSGIDPPEYEKVGKVEFHYLPDTGGITVLGHDTNKNDGISLTWTAPANVSGRIQVGATFGNTGSWIFSPEIHVRTPNTDVVQCKFNPFGIGGDIPVYPIPNLKTEPITTIQMGTTYPLLGMGGEWSTEFGGSGTFYQIGLVNQSGWVQDHRGELIGDCIP